jgi:hypothetical protein
MNGKKEEKIVRKILEHVPNARYDVKLHSLKKYVKLHSLKKNTGACTK